MNAFDRPLSLFASVAPGLEALCAAELAARGVRGAVETGGVAWEGTADDLFRANLHLRTAGRVLVRAARFGARGFPELEKRARKVPWADFVAAGQPFRLRVTAKKSKLYHERAIEERLLRFVAEETGAAPATGATPGDEDDGGAGDDAQLFVVRVFRDEVWVSADASGEHLHRRGYRQATAKAPLRETLGAAVVLGAGWDAASPLLDPMCGAGTIPIEAALLARRIAPGLASADGRPRAFAFQRWPGFDAAAWARVVDEARAAILPAAPAPILGSDRDAGAVEAARANAARAGVAHDVTFEPKALSAAEPPVGPGVLATNPPYGLRVGEADALRDLYAALGNLARRRLAGWTVAMVAANPRLEGHAGLPFREAWRTQNGGIPIRLAVAEIPPR